MQDTLTKFFVAVREVLRTTELNAKEILFSENFLFAILVISLTVQAT